MVGRSGRHALDRHSYNCLSIFASYLRLVKVLLLKDFTLFVQNKTCAFMIFHTYPPQASEEFGVTIGEKKPGDIENGIWCLNWRNVIIKR